MCTATWQYFGAIATWTDAKATCESGGGALLSVMSAEMNAALVEFVAEENAASGPVWVGGNDIENEVRAPCVRTVDVRLLFLKGF